MVSLGKRVLAGTANREEPMSKHEVRETSEAPVCGLPLSVFLGDCGRPRMLALCAEPGMGRRDAMAELTMRAASEGVCVVRRDFRGQDAEAAARQTVRLAREVARRNQPVVVALDEIPPSDESCVRREARALRRMVEAGASVVFSLAPEGRQLLESLPECSVIGSTDLLVRSIAEAARRDDAYELKRLTRGISSLVRGLRIEEGESVSSRSLPSSYFDALAALVSGALRTTLPDESLRVRLCLLLLGQGTVAEVREVAGEVDGGLLARLRVDAPLFGVSEKLDAFACLHSDSETLLTCCFMHLNAVCALFPEVALGCAHLLVRRGAYPRAALVLRMSGATEALALVVEHGAEFVDAGETRLVHDALDAMAAEGHGGDARAVVLGDALAALEGGRSPALEGGSGTCGAADVELLAEAARVLWAQPFRASLEHAGTSVLGTRLVAHRRACDLMASGHFCVTMRLLAAQPCGPSAASMPSVSAALLRLDFELARLLLLDSPARDEGGVERAKGALDSAGLAGLMSYALCVEVASALLLADERGAALADSLVARAERRSETLVQMVALVAGCVFDLRRGACARANVRSLLAAALARKTHMDYLGRIASLLGVVARFLLGERGEALGAGEQPADDLGRVSALAYEAMASEDDAALEMRRCAGEVPRDALWLLHLLSEGMGEFSSLLREEMPQEWSRALAVARCSLGWGADRQRPTAAAAAVPRALASSDVSLRREPPIEIRLLGGLALYARGVRVPDWKLDQRSASSVLAFLALWRGGAVRRYQIVEQVWPDSDYASGFNKVYQATTILRSALAEVDAGLDPFVTSRSNKTVALDASLVRCDVDEFRACAREASDADDDVRAVAMARRAEELYGGDLYVPPADATGYVAATKAELRSLYADAMVAGGDAALRLGQKRTAARLATNAMLVDDMREDAVIVLVQALRASGRNVEADQQYRRYARRLARSSSLPPSRMLRQVAGESGRARPVRAGAVDARVRKAV